MSKVATNGSTRTRPASDTPAVLAIIDHVILLCRASGADAAIEGVVRELEAIRSAVQTKWPLPSDLKKRVNLGPFAAKNIADWDTGLADTLMRLDYSLQHDGKSIDQVISNRMQLESGSRVASIAELEKQEILNTIRQLNGDKLLAAKLLEINKTTLYRKLKEYGLSETVDKIH